VSQHFYLIAPLPDGGIMRDYLFGSQVGTHRVVPSASAAIATVAALAPDDFEVTLCDETIQDIDYNTTADYIGITANVSQALRAIDVAKKFHSLGKKVVMGGPHISLAPDFFIDHCDSIVIGEFEPVAPLFFEDMSNNHLEKKYIGSPADMTTSPMPRWDLYPNECAQSATVQTSRGCPFNCNFCDVIQYVGRKQRHKTPSQIVAEIQVLYDLGHNYIALADDNFTVYRKHAREILSAIADWNGADGRDYVTFGTQVSIDLARDEGLMELCHKAGLQDIFVGIETSNPAALVESRKRQNLYGDLVEECSKLVAAGLKVEPGLIVGFDSDDKTAFNRQFDFVMSLPIATAKISILVAPVATQLFQTMQEQNRLVTDDIITQVPGSNFMTNILPAQMSRAELYIGTRWLISKVFHPENFWIRLNAMAELLVPPVWIENDRKHRPVRPTLARFATSIIRDAMQNDPLVIKLIEKTATLMHQKPDVQSGINDALMNYLMILRSYQDNGMYDQAWAELPSPPFETTEIDERLEHIQKIDG